MIQTIAFYHKGNHFEFTINFNDEQEWASVHSDGKVFDVDYDENYNQISVYNVTDGKPDYTNTIHKQKIN
jgi:hypothetical protein